MQYSYYFPVTFPLFNTNVLSILLSIFAHTNTPQKNITCTNIYIYTDVREYKALTKQNMNMLEHISAISKNACSIVTVSWISMLIIGRLYDFHVSYISFIEQIKSETWLLTHCEDDKFFHNMAYHTDVCAAVLANSKVWPALYGINASMSKMKMCGFYDCFTLIGLVYNGGFPVILCIILFYVVTPSFILPVLQNFYFKYNQEQLMSKCSPSIVTRKKPNSLYYNVQDSYTEHEKGV